MKTVKLSPRGYCHGVVNAINTISNLTNLSTFKTITILGMVIHNKQVVDFFKEKGIKTIHSTSKTRLELLDEIDEGTVVFTAHGVSPEVYKKAKEKGLEVIDTTCADVTKTQKEVRDYSDQGYDVFFIGKKHHPESEAADGISKNVHVIENIDDLRKATINNDKIAVTNQTTMSLYDIYILAEEIRKIYPTIVFIDEICNATRVRQEAVRNQDKSIDHCFVVGDKLSNNSLNLVHVSKTIANISATLVENIEDINIENLKLYNKVSVTSGASTPTRVTNEVIKFLENFDKDNFSTHDNRSKIELNNLIAIKNRSKI
ncbi:4-hydroxy-3-methylbut-2-enyl diphosphate reductase [Candidatus Izimaplasma bacterium HR1]|jgi:4-hydroxy-3-methylbut-2-enyl diphosphate reductase|uniref:4-hydroxy-3-methylbut-2-enyl diphosphate reductase n=1 Tax=Candidatus Izimoplasma sp. HR1 TaxID=1541959 RepID=UPI0004F78AD5|nr:4-hydroxy-3-methylbut-2-enyl diphosphate reductase [Candidatus Izimaplasma bacterium HR1]